MSTGSMQVSSLSTSVSTSLSVPSEALISSDRPLGKMSVSKRFYRKITRFTISIFSSGRTSDDLSNLSILDSIFVSCAGRKLRGVHMDRSYRNLRAEDVMISRDHDRESSPSSLRSLLSPTESRGVMTFVFTPLISFRASDLGSSVSEWTGNDGQMIAMTLHTKAKLTA